MKTLYTSFVFTFIFHILSFGQNFSFNNNGILVCTNASVGESSTIDGVTYTKIDSKNSLQIHGGSVSADEACVSGVTDLEQWFYQKDFNKDIGHWDVSSVTNMNSMFKGASSFGFWLSIRNWNVSSVTNMDEMFSNASIFNEDLSNWCVPLIDSLPVDFNLNGILDTSYYPVWGTCPVQPKVMNSSTNPTASTEANEEENIALVQEDQQLTLVPNPASTSFRIEPQVTEGNYTIINSRGQVVSTGKVRESFNIEGLPSGMYVVRIETADSIESLRLIVE